MKKKELQRLCEKLNKRKEGEELGKLMKDKHSLNEDWKISVRYTVEKIVGINCIVRTYKLEIGDFIEIRETVMVPKSNNKDEFEAYLFDNGFEKPKEN